MYMPVFKTSFRENKDKLEKRGIIFIQRNKRSFKLVAIVAKHELWNHSLLKISVDMSELLLRS